MKNDIDNNISTVLSKLFNDELGDTLFNKIKSQKEKLEYMTKQQKTIPKGSYQLIVLKEFGSFSPLISNGKGGGYFLILNGNGIVIDPGHNFLSNFFNAGFSIGDIDTIIVTHAHDDHTADFEPLITLMYQRVKNKFWPADKEVNVFLNRSSFKKYEWLNNTNRPYLKLENKLIPNRGFKLYDTTIIPVKSKHKEAEYKNYNNNAVGLIFKTPKGIIAFSSDTGWDDRYIQEYKAAIQCKLLILHIGSIIEKEKKYFETGNYESVLYENHLGIIGVCKFINLLQPSCTIISEFGEEMFNYTDNVVSILKECLGRECFAGYLGFRYIL